MPIWHLLPKIANEDTFKQVCYFWELLPDLL